MRYGQTALQDHVLCHGNVGPHYQTGKVNPADPDTEGQTRQNVLYMTNFVDMTGT
jgi:hypothetical protein